MFDVPLVTGASEHDPAAAPVDGVLGGDDSNVNGSLLPQPVTMFVMDNKMMI